MFLHPQIWSGRGRARGCGCGEALGLKGCGVGVRGGGPGRWILLGLGGTFWVFFVLIDGVAS